jgi:hypothetical protein
VAALPRDAEALRAAVLAALPAGAARSPVAEQQVPVAQPRGCGAVTQPSVLRLPAPVFQAQAPAEVRPACDGDEHQLPEPGRAQVPALQALRLRDGGGWRSALEPMHVRVSPSPSGRGLAQSGRR